MMKQHLQNIHTILSIEISGKNYFTYMNNNTFMCNLIQNNWPIELVATLDAEPDSYLSPRD